MGTSSKMSKYKKFKSTKNLKQWCKARGIDFKKHCAEYHIELTK